MESSRGPVDPVGVGREPDIDAGEGAGFAAWLDDRGDEQVIAEDVFVLEGVSVFFFGPVVVEGAAEWEGGVVGFAAGGVDVREEAVAPVEGLFHGGVGIVAEHPDSSFCFGVSAAVRAESGAEDGVLDPSGIKLILDGSGLVSANVV